MPKDKLKRLVGLSTEERFWHHVPERPEVGCWEWVGGKLNGYGLFWDGTYRASGKPRIVRAHRYSLSLSQELTTDDVDHACRNRSCVRPDHLRLATRSQNMQNQSQARTATKSGVRGVKLDHGRWRAEVNHMHVRYSAGSFGTIEEAQAAVIALRNRLHTHNDADRALSA